MVFGLWVTQENPIAPCARVNALDMNVCRVVTCRSMLTPSLQSMVSRVALLSRVTSRLWAMTIGNRMNDCKVEEHRGSAPDEAEACR